MPFLSQVAIRRIGVNRWQLLEDLSYRSPVDGRTYTAHAGYRTDFATVPRVLQGLVPRTGLWDEPAVIHDLGCDDVARHYREVRARRQALNGYGELPPLEAYRLPPVRRPWRDARGVDQLWREALLAGGVGPLLALLLWTAVRWGALFSRGGARRAGWWRDAPAVLLVTAVVAVAAYTAVRLLDAAAHALL